MSPASSACAAASWTCSATAATAHRIEPFGDTVESVRRFDPLDQLSVERLAEAIIVPDLQDEDAASQQPFFAQLPDSAVVWVNSTEGHRRCHHQGPGTPAGLLRPPAPTRRPTPDRNT